MARYYVKFETMKVFLSLKSQATVSEIVSQFRTGSRDSAKFLSFKVLPKPKSSKTFVSKRVKRLFTRHLTRWTVSDIPSTLI